MKIRPAIIIIKKDAILTLKYIYNGNTVFTLPGGNLEFGEKLTEALIRELKEELGIDVKVGKLKFIAEVLTVDSYTQHLAFEGKISGGNPQVNPKETTAEAIYWLPLNQLIKSNLYPSIASEILNNLSSDETKFLGKIEQPWF